MSAVLSEVGNVGLGLHRPYFAAKAYRASPSEIALAQQEMTAKVRDYLRREQVPERFIDLMLERSSKEVYWLHETGDTSSLDGRAPWFDEMMIARCKFDPAYEAQSQKRGIELVEQGSEAQADAQLKGYLEWRQDYNTCEHAIRQKSQLDMRR